MFGFDNPTRKPIAISGILLPHASTSLLVGKWPYLWNVDCTSRIKCHFLNHGVLFDAQSRMRYRRVSFDRFEQVLTELFSPTTLVTYKLNAQTGSASVVFELLLLPSSP